MANAISAPALVYCNCTKPKTGEDSNETNFEIYRYLTVDPDGDRNIFCKDYPFIFSDDTKPYINIEKPFPYCRSENYGFAVKNLEEYAQNKCMEAITEKAGDSEILMWSEAEAVFHNAYQDYVQKEKMKNKQYQCLLQVVDRWFNTSNETINNYFTWSQEIKERLEQIKNAFWQVVSKAKKKLKDAQPGVWERLSDSLTKLLPKLEDVVVDLGSGTFTFNFKEGARRFDKSWNSDRSLSWFNDRMKEMSEIMDAYSDMVCDEVFFADNQDFMNTGLGEARDLFLEFQEVMTELDFEDDLDFNTSLEDFKGKLNMLLPDDKFREDKKQFLTNASLLVCRCGGIINIVYDGQALNKNFTKVYDNFINLLVWIENYLYNQIFSSFDDYRMPVSIIDGYNFVKLILLSIGQNTQYDFFIKPIVDGKDQEGFGVEMNITIQSRSVINKKEKLKTGALSLLGSSLGSITKYIKYGKYASIGASVFMEAVDPNPANATGVGISVVSAFPSSIANKLGTLAGDFLIINGLADAISNFNYDSTADYVGEIKVVMRLGVYDITLSRSYDINGDAKDDKTDVNKQARMKPYARLDPSKSALVSGEELAELNFDNVINVETTLAVDVDKLEKVKEKYSVNKEGISEK